MYIDVLKATNFLLQVKLLSTGEVHCWYIGQTICEELIIQCHFVKFSKYPNSFLISAARKWHLQKIWIWINKKPIDVDSLPLFLLQAVQPKNHYQGLVRRDFLSKGLLVYVYIDWCIVFIDSIVTPFTTGKIKQIKNRSVHF